MKGFKANIEKASLENSNFPPGGSPFRDVIQAPLYMQGRR
jgi:hypothetical protein